MSQQQQQQQQQQQSSNSAISFEDVQRKIQDVVRGFDSSVNAEQLARVAEMRREVDRQCKTQQQQLGLIAQKLQQRIELTRKTAERTEPEEEYQQRMDLLTRELHDIETSCNNLDQQCRDETERIRALGEQVAQLEEDMVQRQGMFAHERGVLRAKEQLYSYLVPVMWDHSVMSKRPQEQQQLQQNGTVAGFFHFVKGGQEDVSMEDDGAVDGEQDDALHGFQLQEANLLPYDISNQLWQVMYTKVK